jgi:hypothetical protein
MSEVSVEVEAIIVIALTVAIIGGAILGMMKVTNTIEFRSAEAAIEALRIDLKVLDLSAGEDVIGQATTWNQKIRRWQRQNQMIVLGWTIPDGWDDIDLLPIPRAQ